MASNIIDDLRKFARAQLATSKNTKGIKLNYYACTQDGLVYQLTRDNNFLYKSYEDWLADMWLRWKRAKKIKMHNMMNYERAQQAEIRYAMKLSQRIAQDMEDGRDFVEWCKSCLTRVEQEKQYLQQLTQELENSKVA